MVMISKEKGRIILTLPLWQIEFLRKLADASKMTVSEYFEKVFLGSKPTEDDSSDNSVD